MKRMVIIAVGAGLSMSGCLTDRYEGEFVYETPPSRPVGRPPAPESLPQDLRIRDGWLSGSLGAHESFSASAYQQTGLGGYGLTEVELHAGADFWVMAGVTIEGSLDHASLVPGARLEFPRDQLSDLSISVLGVAGPSPDHADFEAQADRIQVEVLEGATPEDRVLHFRAFFRDGAGTQELEGSFTYVPLSFEPPIYEEPWGRDLGLQQGHLSGSMGAIRGFSADAYQTEGFDDGTYANVTLHAGSGFWVMTSMSFEGGGLTHPELAPGAVRTYRQADRTYDGTSGGLFISAIGCSGPSHGDWDYDGPADEVQVQVLEGPTADTRVLRFQARFGVGSSSPQIVDGSVSYAVAPAGI